MSVLVTHPELVAEVARQLAAAGVPSPRVDARWLVEHVAGVAGDPAGEGRQLLEQLTRRRVAREPLQLVVGSTGFRTVELVCRPGVFVPRPETEVVAGVAVDAARAAGGGPLVVDVCTGSGAIACALLAEVPGARIVATDLAPAATALAAENLHRVAAGEAGPPGAAPGASATVVRGHLLDAVEPGLCGQLDVLVANPPYLPSADRGTFAPEVADHDPDEALVGGVDGHELVDLLLVAASAWLAPGGSVVVEIDERRAADARRSATDAGLVEVRVVDDLTGAARVVVARRPA